MKVTVKELVERLAQCVDLLRVEIPDGLNDGEKGVLACARNCVGLAGMLLETRVLPLVYNLLGKEDAEDDE